jgi:hypothetical protein
MSRRHVPFTKAQIRRVVAATEDAGQKVRSVRVYQDGSIEVLTGDSAYVPDGQNDEVRAGSWDDL